MKDKTIMLSAGEVSGDIHASFLVRALKKHFPNTKLCGLGGPVMSSFGFESFWDFDKFNKMGFLEVARHLPFFLKAKKEFVKKIEEIKPKLLICVDYSGFNIPLMKAAKKLSIPVLWYIPPKFWAWKRKKYASALRDYADMSAAIFPFEPKEFLEYSNKMRFVGNPLVEEMNECGITFKEKKINNLNMQIALIPGSRRQEIEEILPTILDATTLLSKKYRGIKFILSKFKAFSRNEFEILIKQHAANANITITEKSLEKICSESDFAIVTSGTATLQTALTLTPLVVVYKTSVLSYILYRLMIRGIKDISLPNIIFGERVLPELVQKNVTPENIANEISRYIEDRNYRKEVSEKLLGLRSELGDKKPSEEICKIIEELF